MNGEVSQSRKNGIIFKNVSNEYYICNKALKQKGQSLKTDPKETLRGLNAKREARNLRRKIYLKFGHGKQ